MPNMQLGSCTHEGNMSRYVSYLLTRIKNVTRDTGIHTLHITDICPWKNIPVTLHFCCSLQRDPILVHIQIKKQHSTFIYYTYPSICHICASCTNCSVCIDGGSMPIYILQMKSLWSKLVCRMGQRKIDGHAQLHKLICQISYKGTMNQIRLLYTNLHFI